MELQSMTIIRFWKPMRFLVPNINFKTYIYKNQCILQGKNENKLANFILEQFISRNCLAQTKAVNAMVFVVRFLKWGWDVERLGRCVVPNVLLRTFVSLLLFLAFISHLCLSPMFSPLSHTFASHLCCSHFRLNSVKE